MKQLKDLTKDEFEQLKDSGLLWVIYPEAPASYSDLTILIPKIIENPNFSSLKEIAKDIHRDAMNGNSLEDDPQYAFETLMETFYGKEYWKWYNKQINK